ncbi:MAG: hypothetical protein HY252_01300 [Sphingobacteriales bacterium]|nr:hypothetical protein [Sphingobacteriales bacterium]
MKVSDALNKNLFWDVNPEKLDWKRNRVFIVERVFVRGGMNDVRIVMNYYPKEELVNIIRQCRDLDHITHNFCSNYFNIPKSQMHAPSQYYK